VAVAFRGLGPAGLGITFLVGVLFEEVLYRSYLCTRLKDLGWGGFWIALATSVLFALPHIFEGWGILPTTALFGLVLAAVFMRAKTVWPGYIGHLAYDLFLVAMALRQ